MTTACCPANPLQRPLPQRWLDALHRAWCDWRAHSRRLAEDRALLQLSDHTRRDLGLAERSPLTTERTLWDHERGLW